MGEVSLGCFAPLAPTYLPGLIVQLQKQYPGLELKVVEGSQREITQGMHAGKLQYGLVYDLDLPESVHKTKLMQVQPQVLLPAKHKLARKKHISIQELACEPMVLLDVSPSRTYFTRLFEQQGLQAMVAYRSSSLELVRGLVGRGLGFSILVTRPSGDITYDGQKLVVRPLTHSVEPSTVTLCRLQAVRPGKIGGAFTQVASEYFKQFAG